MSARLGLGLAAAAAALFALASWARPGPTAALADWPRHALADYVPEQGFAFRCDLPAGAPNAADGPIRAALLENGDAIGEGAEHDAIRTIGRGRHSFWHGTLYFTASDNSDPRTNGRRYEVAWPLPPAAAWPHVVIDTAAFAAAALAGGMLLAAAVRAGLPDRRRRRRVAFGLVAAGFATGLALGSVELVLRWRYPFADSNWPGAFDPEIGFHFAPQTELRRTNLSDYCIAQTTNSLGFADREPPAVTADERRILVLGDSFVEAVQVPIAQKLHVQLEQRLRERGDRVATMALGMSGSGTSTELAFYRHIGRRFTPNLVVLVFVNNDVANNSALLEALRYGWDPQHTPRPYFVPDGASWAWQPVDPAWAEFAAKPPPAVPPAWHQTLFGWSRLYRWTEASLAWIGGSSAAQVDRELGERIAALARPEWRAALQGWQPGTDLDIDSMMLAADAPTAFRDAVGATEAALRALRDAVAADGARLLVVFAENVSIWQMTNPKQRPLPPRAWLDLVEPICSRLAVPTLDLAPAFTAAGVSGRVTFARDRHWNALGHATAAVAIAAHLAAHPELLVQR